VQITIFRGMVASRKTVITLRRKRYPVPLRSCQEINVAILRADHVMAVGRAIAFRGLPGLPIKGRRQKTIACPTGLPTVTVIP
jgi:hypothetical protein